eukprot:3587499-Amphidinium_carterae.1
MAWANSTGAPAEYLCTLQPRKGSWLENDLLHCRGKCLRAGLGHDTTGLYPPHVTLVGFFKATSQQ